MTESQLLVTLEGVDESLVDDFLASANLLRDTISQASIQSWQEMTRQLADEFPHETEVLRSFLAISPLLLREIDARALKNWTDQILSLGHRSPLLAKAFISASPSVVPRLEPVQTTYWANMGLRLASRGWKSIQLACEFFDVSADLLCYATTGVNNQLVNLLCEFELHSVELATSCLNLAPQIFRDLPQRSHESFLELAGVVHSKSPADTWLYFDKGPEQIRELDLGDPADLVTRIVAVTDEPPFALLSEITTVFSLLEEEVGQRLYRSAARIADRDTISAGIFLKSVPGLLARIETDQVDTWIERGLSHILEPLTLRFYFGLESTLADTALTELSGRVEFERTANLLNLYALALSGQLARVQVFGHTNDADVSFAGFTDSRSITVPEHIDAFMNREENLLAYKVCIAHQSSRLHCGSFEFEFGRDGDYLKSSLLNREAIQTESFVCMQRYFNLFSERGISLQLFTLVDDYRIDRHVADEYPGLAHGIEAVMAYEAERRPKYQLLSLQQVFIENLLLVTLEHYTRVRWPAISHPVMLSAIGVLGIVHQPGATVEDCAEVSAWLYDLTMMIPNNLASTVMTDWCALPEREIPRYSVLPELPDFHCPGGPISRFEPPQVSPMAFRGDYSPEFAQVLSQLDEMSISALGKEMVEEKLENMLAQSVEAAAESVSLEELLATVGSEDESDNGKDSRLTGLDTEEISEVDDAVKWSHYDEWDFRANDYRRAWCQVSESAVVQRGVSYYENTLGENHSLVVDIRRQFELMRPENQRRVRNLDDGPELDLEQAIAFQVDKKAGAGPRARFYSRRDKLERSVAASFLLDMSGSTSEAVEIPDTANMAGFSDPDELIPTRIIDLERTAIVLIMEALESVGDAYGVYGFSGYGRGNVNFLVVKEMGQPLDDVVRKRVDGIEALRSTRMGAAIRHATSKLKDYPAKVKLLILISDGRPEDQGYGQDRDDVDYAIHDTRQALLECKEEGIVPFLITVDRKGDDYLKTLCHDLGYEVVNNIQSLPRRLPAIYRSLTGSR